MPPEGGPCPEEQCRGRLVRLAVGHGGAIYGCSKEDCPVRRMGDA